MSNTPEAYLNEIGRYPLLTPDQEINLGRAIQAHLGHPDYPDVPVQVRRRGERAMRRLVSSNLRLVVHIARQYERRILKGAFDVNDLIQEGSLGLIRAAEKFDPERGYRFSTYSYWWIKQSMQRAVETKQRLVRLPANIAEAMGKRNKVFRELSNKLGRLPTSSEMADGLGLTPELYRELLKLDMAPLSLDGTVSGTEDLYLIDLVVDPTSALDAVEDAVQASQWLEWLATGWQFLRPEEQELLCRRYGLGGYQPETYVEMQKSMGVTRERCRQKVVEAQRRLRLLSTPTKAQSQAGRYSQSPAVKAPAGSWSAASTTLRSAPVAQRSPALPSQWR